MDYCEEEALLAELESAPTEIREQAIAILKAPYHPSAFKTDPAGYATHILKIRLTDPQTAILQALLQPPYRVKVDSGHNIGKTFVAAVAVNWWFDSFNPGVVVSTAPTQRDVEQLLWTEIRLQRQRAGLKSWLSPRAAEMRDSEEHWAYGFTAQKGESFQGRHRERMLFIFDEAEGVDASYFTTTKTMFRPGSGDAWLCIGNPTTVTSQSYLETLARDAEGRPTWHLMRLSCLDHPNITGRGPQIPGAITPQQLDAMVQDFCEPVGAHESQGANPQVQGVQGDSDQVVISPLDPDRQEDDFEWRGRLWRPGPEGMSRILGLRPKQPGALWSESLWRKCCASTLQPDIRLIPQIGCDVARKGDDMTEMHCRWDTCSYWHESHNGWTGDQILERLFQLADGAAAIVNRARNEPQAKLITGREVLVVLDDSGMAGAYLCDIARRKGWNFAYVHAGARAVEEARYPNRRSELWFATAERARLSLLSLAGISKRWQDTLMIQALTPTWKPDNKDRRVVEPKEKIKERLPGQRSPDGMDALNLAYCSVGQGFPLVPKKEPQPLRVYQTRKSTGRRLLFGNRL